MATSKKTPAKKAESVAVEGSTSRVHVYQNVIIRPLVSEKGITNEARGVYTFVVRADATKIDVKQAVAELYRVKPLAVRMINMEGKSSVRGRRSDWKKALVTLPKDAKISIHEGV